MGCEVNLLVISTDSSSAKAFVCTRGLGRMRHLEVKDLWMQELVRNGRLKVTKIRGDKNPSNILTKFLDRAALLREAALGGFRVVPTVVDDRAEGGC